MSINVAENDPKVVEAILRKDFYAFIQAVFPLVSPNRPLMRNWHLEAMAYALTRVLKGEIRRLIITVPPRSLKSICASIAFPAFALGHRPQLRFICASYAENLAKPHSRSCRDVMRSRLLPPTVSAHQNRPKSRQPDRIYNHARRLPDGDVGRRNFDRTRRKFRHYRRPYESSGYFLRNSAGDRLGMVRTHSSLPARQQGGGLNCGGDAAPSCR